MASNGTATPVITLRNPSSSVLAPVKVFSITELCEQIFEDLSIAQILHATRVCKHFRSVVDGSKGLKQRLFLEAPTDKTPYTWALERSKSGLPALQLVLAGKRPSNSPNNNAFGVHVLNPALCSPLPRDRRVPTNPPPFQVLTQTPPISDPTLFTRAREYTQGVLETYQASVELLEPTYKPRPSPLPKNCSYKDMFLTTPPVTEVDMVIGRPFSRGLPMLTSPNFDVIRLDRSFRIYRKDGVKFGDLHDEFERMRYSGVNITHTVQQFDSIFRSVDPPATVCYITRAHPGNAISNNVIPRGELHHIEFPGVFVCTAEEQAQVESGGLVHYV